MRPDTIISADELEKIMLFAYSVAFKLFLVIFAFHAALVTGALPYALSLDPNYNCGSQYVVKSSAMVMSFVTLMFLITNAFVHDEFLMMWGRYSRAALKDGRFILIKRKIFLITIYVVCAFAIIASEVRFAWRVNHFQQCSIKALQPHPAASPPAA